MVSMAREDLPEPEGPVMTVMASLGMERLKILEVVLSGALYLYFRLHGLIFSITEIPAAKSRAPHGYAHQPVLLIVPSGIVYNDV